MVGLCCKEAFLTVHISRLAQDHILEAVAAGERLSDVCAAAGVSESTLFRYRRKVPEFGRQFDLALADSVECDMLALRDLARLEPSAEGAERIALGTATAEDLSLTVRARARETQFRILAWYITHRAPGKYGDKLALDVTQRLDMRQVLLGAEARIARLTAQRTLHLGTVSTAALEPVG